MTQPSFTLKLPEWINKEIEKNGTFSSDEQKMQFVINCGIQNVKLQTGGPFAAALFNAKTHELIAPGVNVVVASHCSLAHAEMMAIGIAQQKLGSFELGKDTELFTSTAPCAMCLGAIPWSGVGRVVCAARDEDARAIGFDEGAKIDNWIDALTQRGISVTVDFMRTEGKAVLDLYASLGGKIYNGTGEE
ncbi:MAG: nucleoside deaminase [Fibrobacter sp.]|nr:nucleoside deaminase [Fibrobacter sp.]